jgi:hypothetical protein
VVAVVVTAAANLPSATSNVEIAAFSGGKTACKRSEERHGSLYAGGVQLGFRSESVT